MTAAPIALFVFNRPRHTQQTLAALAKNIRARESDLIVFADGPRSEADRARVKEVREVVRSASGFRSVTVRESDSNLGLASSIISGITKLFQTESRLIVLEDDMVTAPHFLSFMNDALNLYEEEERVISVHGYMYPVAGRLPETFFIRGADCWGWATWKRGWNLFNADGKSLLKELENRKLTSSFDFAGTFPYTRMLKAQIRGVNDSWAIRWYASAFLAGKLTLYPGISLVHNIGNDSSGTHQADTSTFDATLADDQVRVKKIPLEENAGAKRMIADYFAQITPSMFRKVLGRLRSRKGWQFIGKYIWNRKA